LSFSAACKTHLYLQLFAARLKSCPCYKALQICRLIEFFRSLQNPRLISAICDPTEEAAEKLQIWSETRKKHTSAAKATLIPLALYRG